MTVLAQDLIVFDTPGLSDSRVGFDRVSDEQIKDEIELSILQVSETTQNVVNAFLLFETCEERIPRMRQTIEAMS